MLVDDSWLGFDEWICADHWRLVDRELRRVHAQAKRRLRRRRDRRSAKLAGWLWSRCRRQAVERAVGISA